MSVSSHSSPSPSPSPSSHSFYDTDVEQKLEQQQDGIRRRPAPYATTTIPTQQQSQQQTMNNQNTKPTTPSSSSTSSSSATDSETSNFDCNICLFSCSEPVITLCGHLFCWPCLYKWLEQSGRSECPVCKAGVTKQNVIPLYGRGADQRDPRHEPPSSSSSSSSSIPSRPSGQRPTAPPPRPPPHSQHAHAHAAHSPFGFPPFGPALSFNNDTYGFSFSAGFGFFPSLFGLHFFNTDDGTGAAPAQPGAGVGAAEPNPANFGVDEAGAAHFNRFLLTIALVALLILFSH